MYEQVSSTYDSFKQLNQQAQVTQTSMMTKLPIKHYETHNNKNTWRNHSHLDLTRSTLVPEI